LAATLSKDRIVEWDESMMVEIAPCHEKFNIVTETLTRMGLADTFEKTLRQSCYVLCEHGRYFIMHFKELYAHDGESVKITEDDIRRRNRIIQMLVNYDLIEVVSDNFEVGAAFDPDKRVKLFILPHNEKPIWTLISNYDFSKRDNES